MGDPNISIRVTIRFYSSYRNRFCELRDRDIVNVHSVQAMHNETKIMYTAARNAHVAVFSDIYKYGRSSWTNITNILCIWRGLLYSWNLSMMLWSDNPRWNCVSVLVNLLGTHTSRKHTTQAVSYLLYCLPPMFICWAKRKKRLRVCLTNGFVNCLFEMNLKCELFCFEMTTKHVQVVNGKETSVNRFCSWNSGKKERPD